MTPPHPTAPTAAELREKLATVAHALLREHRKEYSDLLDALLATARAEALEEAAKVCDDIRNFYYAGVVQRTMTNAAERIRALVSK